MTEVFTDGFQDRRETNRVVVSPMGTPDGEPRSSFQLRQLEMAEFKDGAGYHFAVDVDGQIYEGRRLDAVGHFSDEHDWDSVIIRWAGSRLKTPKQEKAIFVILQRMHQLFPTAQHIDL